MPELAVIQSPSVSAANASAAEWLLPLLGQSEILIVGATRTAADEFVRALPVAGTFGLHRLTLTQLAVALASARMAEDGLAPATRLALEAVCARSLDRARRNNELTYFAPVAKSPGFPAALANTLTDLRLARVRPESDNPAGADIARLLDLFEGELRSRKLVDLAAILEIAGQGARAGVHSLLGLPVLLLDVPLPSDAHASFVQSLAARTPSLCATVLAADAARLATYSRLTGATPRSAGNEAAGAGALALHRVRAYVFSPEPPPVSSYDDSLDLFSAPGESLEAVEIARRIRLLADSGTRFDEVAILLRHPDRYQPIIEEALRRAGVPAHFSRGTARPAPAGRAFLALLACASEGCSASRFAEYLSLGQIPPLDAAGSPPRREPVQAAAQDELLTTFGGAATASEPSAEERRDPTVVATPLAWEKLLVDAAVIGKYERWPRRLRGLENEFRIQLESLSAEEQAERERLERELDRLGNLERFALPLIEDLHALPQSAPWGEWLDALRRLAARALADPEPVTAVLNELEPMAEIGPVELGEVQIVLAERLRFLRTEPARRRYGQVFIGSIDEARGLAFEVVFVPGLAEGLFPQKATEDPLLLDDLRDSISPALRKRTDRVLDERLLLRTAAASATRRFVVSYPSMDLAQGRPRVPSFYALEIARAVEGRVPPLRSFEMRLSQNAEARLVWPAPTDPVRAIDDAEYDLSWLAAHAQETGSARYLMDVNPHLSRSLRARWSRWDGKWSAADGFVKLDGAALDLLQEQRLTVRDYSPSALQNYALCPYRFALNGVLRLKERQNAAAIEQLDPLTRGAMVHEVQREFLRWWKQDPAANQDVLLARLDEVLTRIAAGYAERIAPAIPRVWASEVEQLRTDLRGWMVDWFAQTAEWEPAHFELAFGLRREPEAHDPASRPDPVVIDGIRVRGSIDMVERHRHSGKLRVTDHKTGRPPDQPPTSIAGGRVLQPVLYSLAAEQMLGAQAAAGRLWYCTQRGKHTEYGIPIDQQARDRFIRAMQLINGAIETGFLPAAPAKEACQLCEYRPVCGPNEEVRARRKSGDELDGLNQLRSLP